MSRDTIETPWGELGIQAPSFTDSRFSTGEIDVPTSAGRAVTSFHVDQQVGSVPETLRVVMLAGYSNPGFGGGGHRTGQSALNVGGAALGWRAQAYLDPATGEVASDKGVEVMLVDGGGKIMDCFPKAAVSVGQAVAASFTEAREVDPGMVARIYATLAGSLVDELEEDVRRAERALRDAEGLRDRARALVGAAAEVAEAQVAPTP